VGQVEGSFPLLNLRECCSSHISNEPLLAINRHRLKRSNREGEFAFKRYVRVHQRRNVASQQICGSNLHAQALANWYWHILKFHFLSFNLFAASAHACFAVLAVKRI
jgi:hypothetical protein